MKKAFAIIGEGITEKYYIESLKGLTRFNVLPKALNNRASSLKELEKFIKNAIAMSIDEVFCLIDMDDKQSGKSATDYKRLKEKYHEKFFGPKKKGVHCKVTFIETERCTELWFLYHFINQATTREFRNYNELQNELRKFRPNYEKTERYFKSISNLHREMTIGRQPIGSLKNALDNASSSLISRDRDERAYTYSEMHLLFDSLGIEP